MDHTTLEPAGATDFRGLAPGQAWTLALGVDNHEGEAGNFLPVWVGLMEVFGDGQLDATGQAPTGAAGVKQEAPGAEASSAGTEMERLAELAGTYAAHSVWSVSDGGPLMPCVATVDAQNKCLLRRFAIEDLGHAVAEAKKFLDASAETAVRAVLVHDGYIHLESGKTDALIVIAKSWSGTEAFTMAVPYREASKGFAVFRPKLLETSNESETDALVERFFVGVDKHKPAAKVWNRHLDQSQ